MPVPVARCGLGAGGFFELVTLVAREGIRIAFEIIDVYLIERRVGGGLGGSAVVSGHNSLFSDRGTYGNMKLFSIL